LNTRPLAPQTGGPTRAPGSLRPWRKAPGAARWLVLPAGIGADAGLAYVNRSLGTIVTLIEVAGAIVIILVLLTTILYGSKDTCERAFRLLRWIRNQPEPSQIQTEETAIMARPRHSASAAGPVGTRL